MSKVIVVTGGSDGLGKALAKSLSIDHTVIILAPNKDKTKKAAKELDCSFKVCDISVWKQVDEAINSILAEYGQVDVLINNAGVAYGGKIENITPEQAEHTFGVNVIGQIYATKAVVPGMKSRGAGHIININSQGGLYTKPERTLYNGSKWAMTGITKVLQAELAPFGVKVTGLYPGAMEQKMAKDGERGPQENSISYQDMIDAIRFIISLPADSVVPELGLKNLSN